MHAYRDGISPYFPGKKWGSFSTHGMSTAFTFQLPDFLDIDQRGALNYIGFNFPKRANAASVYLSATLDEAGQSLMGDRAYRLHVPANVPARQYWSVTVYDLERGTFIRNAPRVTLDSYDRKVPTNADGSKDVHFGAEAPVGQEASWVHTEAGKPWFAIFRFYGPEQSLTDKMWVLPDIQEVKP